MTTLRRRIWKYLKLSVSRYLGRTDVGQHVDTTYILGRKNGVGTPFADYGIHTDEIQHYLYDDGKLIEEDDVAEHVAARISWAMLEEMTHWALDAETNESLPADHSDQWCDVYDTVLDYITDGKWGLERDE